MLFSSVSCVDHVPVIESTKPVGGADSVEDSDIDLSDYQLEQVVVLSRHNLRAPLSSNGSVPQELTPHQWIPLTRRGQWVLC